MRERHVLFSEAAEMAAIPPINYLQGPNVGAPLDSGHSYSDHINSGTVHGELKPCKGSWPGPIPSDRREDTEIALKQHFCRRAISILTAGFVSRSILLSFTPVKKGNGSMHGVNGEIRTEPGRRRSREAP